MKAGKAFVTFAAILAVLVAAPLHAFNQPLLNYGLTDALDGAVPGPGTYFFEYIQIYQSDEFKDKDGNNFSGNPRATFVLSMNQVAHISTKTVLGGNLGFDVLQPIGQLNGSGYFGAGGPAVTANPGPLGDLIVGPFIQWFPHKLLGRPFLHRFELDVVLPTGQFDQKYILNPGAKIWTIEPYYAFTWFLTPEFSTSWRLHYAYNTENDDTKMKPGQLFHANYSFEYEVVKNLRLALTGYYIKQLTDDEANGVKQNSSKEQAFAIGPGIHWISPGGLSFGLKTQIESSVENRPAGNRTTFRLTYKF
ncbi:MAG: transporter [Deltaproteobacteria bacterium]|nr:transporter [Deltaproteobacteria bacterium]